MATVIGSVITTDEVGIRDVCSYLATMEYPAGADAIVNMVVLGGANRYIRAAVSEISAGIYNSETDVITELTRLGYV